MSTQIYRWVEIEKDGLPDMDNVSVWMADANRKMVFEGQYEQDGEFFKGTGEPYKPTHWQYSHAPLAPWEINTQERETAEQVLNKYFSCDTYIGNPGNEVYHEDKCRRCELEDKIFSAMKEYASQFSTSVPVSAIDQAVIDTQIFYGHNPTRGKHQVFREEYLSSFLPKKP